jgi:hypothetical protein
MNRIIPLSELKRSDLIIDAIYEGGISGHAGDDPLSKLMNCGNQAGFRKVGRRKTKFVVLYSSLEDRDWPDHIDISTGLFTYYGDNKKPGHGLHETPGNQLLQQVFGAIHSHSSPVEYIPPFFIFTKFPTKSSRSVQFRGLAAPGAEGITSSTDLVAIWKSDAGQRFQNYKALFTILDIAQIRRAWIDDLLSGNPLSDNAPLKWREWALRKSYSPLIARPNLEFRTIPEQLPQTNLEKEILSCVFEYFQKYPSRFEACAASIVMLLDQNFIVDEITRATVDGGRDAIGRYRLGPTSDPIFLDFALEAKCYSPGLDGHDINTLGVRETSRLIARLRHRQFGLLVTTSVVSRQAYRELRQDQHPVIILCGRDIANLLIEKGFNSRERVKSWLINEFPLDYNTEAIQK